MTAAPAEPRLTAFAPQFLVDDLNRSLAFYSDVLGFNFGAPWGGFYAVGQRDGGELHIKHAPKLAAERAHRRDQEHLDAYATVAGIEPFYAHCIARGADIIKPLAATPWGTTDFYLADPDGYILCFGEVVG
jgi:catechol 2,3-dioxygenase-like lactoylglutathione lyase family enzyme